MGVGCVHLYCGDGKGKTTAALGLAFRALGHGLPVRMVQFLKGREAGEHATARRLGMEIALVPAELPPWDLPPERLRQNCQIQMERARQWSHEMGPGLLILDEVLGAVAMGLVAEDDLLHLIRGKSPELELVLTGRGAGEALIAAADYVTEMKKVKHPFDRGLAARDGVER